MRNDYFAHTVFFQFSPFDHHLPLNGFFMSGCQDVRNIFLYKDIIKEIILWRLRCAYNFLFTNQRKTPIFVFFHKFFIRKEKQSTQRLITFFLSSTSLFAFLPCCTFSGLPQTWNHKKYIVFFDCICKETKSIML